MTKLNIVGLIERKEYIFVDISENMLYIDLNEYITIKICYYGKEIQKNN